MPKDLRQFIQLLEKEYPDEILRVKEQVSPLYQPVGLVRMITERRGRAPAIIFENVEGSRMPLIINVGGTMRRIAAAFGVPQEQLLEEYVRRESRTLSTKIASSGPVKEVVQKGDQVDFNEFPIVWHYEQDAGKYIDAAVTIGRHPETGRRNDGLYRFQIQGKNRFSMLFSRDQHLRMYYDLAESRGEPLDVAIVLGHHPTFTVGGQAVVPLDVDELEVTASIMDEPLEMVKGETIDLEYPAHAEIVFEGKILPNDRLTDGPFGESFRYIGIPFKMPIVEVTAVVHRSNPIYQTVVNAYHEHHQLGALRVEGLLWRRLKSSHSGRTVKAVHAPYSGCARLSAYVSFEKEYEGQGKEVLMNIFAAHPMLKFAVVVDPDVNVYNEDEVIWAVVTRAQADKDLLIVPHAAGNILDPSTYSMGGHDVRGELSSKLGIDATKPRKLPFQELSRVGPGVRKTLEEKFPSLLTGRLVPKSDTVAV